MPEPQVEYRGIDRRRLCRWYLCQLRQLRGTVPLAVAILFVPDIRRLAEVHGLCSTATLAVVALERAHKSCPEHRLAALLRFLMDSGQLNPDAFRAQLAEGCQQARELLGHRDGKALGR